MGNDVKVKDFPFPRLITKKYTVDDSGWNEDVVLRYSKIPRIFTTK